MRVKNKFPSIIVVGILLSLLLFITIALTVAIKSEINHVFGVVDQASKSDCQCDCDC